MDLQLKDKAAIVTGASRGIGLATVQRLVEEGVRVVAAARTAPEELQRTGAHVVTVDLGDPDGPERLALMREAERLLIAYMPQKINVHRIGTDLTQPWLVGFRRPVFWLTSWQYLDILPGQPPHD